MQSISADKENNVALDNIEQESTKSVQKIRTSAAVTTSLLMFLRKNFNCSRSTN